MSQPIPLMFAAPFPLALFTGEKNKTFRVAGKFQLDLGTCVSLQLVESRFGLATPEFARAEVSGVTRKRFYDFTKQDWEGHETFESDYERDLVYSDWNGFPVGAATLMDIISYSKFEITDQRLVEEFLEESALKQSQPKCTDDGTQFPFPHKDPNSPNYNPYKLGGDNPSPHMRC